MRQSVQIVLRGSKRTMRKSSKLETDESQSGSHRLPTHADRHGND